MYEISKMEFGKWLLQQNVSKMSSYERTMIGIIIDHFDEIAKCGIPHGARAKLIGKYIEALDNQADRKELSLQSIELSDEVVKRLVSLSIEYFRGFGVKENFDFSTQYTFYHGPNGSGKTSFCEAIEYSVLGTIAESSARNIPVEKYIAHAGKRKGNSPILQCEIENGEIKQFPTNLSKYRFAFIEKNRIVDFSHMGAATAKNQVERIAALFGLSEFRTFVNEFTESFDERYVLLKSDIQDVCSRKAQEIEQKRERKTKLEELVKVKIEELDKTIRSLNVPEIVDVKKAIGYLTDTKEGLLTKANKAANEHHIDKIDEDAVAIFRKAVCDFLEDIGSIKKCNEEILSDIASVNLVNVLEAIRALKDTYNEDVCPVCRTPLANVIKNPFDYAEATLAQFKKIDEAKALAKSKALDVVRELKKISDRLTQKGISSLLSGIDSDIIFNASIQATDYEVIDSSLSILIKQIQRIQSQLEDDVRVKEKIDVYNKEADANNRIYEDEVSKLQNLYGQINSASAALNEVQSQLDVLVEELSLENPELEKLQQEAKVIAQKIEFNTKMITAYESIRRKLSLYLSKLPAQMAANLSERAREYYNYINKGDAEFELIEELKLPIAASEKIMVKMRDGISQDALHILSEGHVRILGLSILLAKAITEGMPFIVFDDIVNCIDDDHRAGVASLLITHADFANTQMILTCHGELFVTSLESYVTDRKKVTRYMFLPADSLEERGIVIKYQDSTIPIKVAREKYKSGELKDAAAKCRQAVECISGTLWKKITEKAGGISVQLRSLHGNPDLKQVVDALKNATKPSKIVGVEDIHALLVELTNMRVWNLLNKGTHVDETLPEFSHPEIKELLDVVEKLNGEVSQLKIIVTAK